jgi:hypothetical protein
VTANVVFDLCSCLCKPSKRHTCTHLLMQKAKLYLSVRKHHVMKACGRTGDLVSSVLSFDYLLDGGMCSSSRSGQFTTDENSPWYTFCWSLLGPHSRCGYTDDERRNPCRFRECGPGRPVYSSHCADWAVLVHINLRKYVRVNTEFQFLPVYWLLLDGCDRAVSTTALWFSRR